MAQRVQIIMEDDLDGSPADQSVNFSLDGVSYEIDLSDEHATQLRDALAPWITAGRRVGGRRTTKPAKGPDSGTIREWAQANGYEVSPRGRIAAEVRDAYLAAH